MSIQELVNLLLENRKIIRIEFEDYNGNTIFNLDDLDLADIEEGDIIRLQINKA